MKFADALTAEMIAEGLTQAKLGAELGASQPTVWGWVSGENLPGTKHYLRLINRFPNLRDAEFVRNSDNSVELPHAA